MLVQGLGEHDRVDHRQPGTGPEGEVRGVGSVADENQVVVAPGLVGHLGKAQPPRLLPAGLADQRMAVKGLLEDLLQ